MAWLVRLAVIVAAVAVLYDATRPPSRQATARVAIAGIHAYRRVLSPAARSGALLNAS